MPTTAQRNDESRQTLAHYVAAGMSLSEAAEKASIPFASARVIERSPLFAALVTKYKAEQSSPITERLVGTLEAFLEDVALPRLGQLMESEKDSTALAAIKTTADIYKALTTKDAKAVEASFTVVLSDRETATLHELMNTVPVLVAPIQPVQSSRQLLATLEESQM